MGEHKVNIKTFYTDVGKLLTLQKVVGRKTSNTKDTTIIIF